MPKTIIGLFRSAQDAQSALQELVAGGVPQGDVRMQGEPSGETHYAGPRLVVSTDDYTADIVYKVLRGYDADISVDVSGSVYESGVSPEQASQPTGEEWNEAAKPPGLTGISLAGGAELMTNEGMHAWQDNPPRRDKAQPTDVDPVDDTSNEERIVRPREQS
jgi:hypothetical protein